jgi:hypothetical protein
MHEHTVAWYLFTGMNCDRGTGGLGESYFKERGWIESDVYVFWYLYPMGSVSELRSWRSIEDTHISGLKGTFNRRNARVLRISSKGSESQEAK